MKAVKKGKVSEYGGKEMYKSKAHQMVHEMKESKAKEAKEKKTYKMGGKIC